MKAYVEVIKLTVNDIVATSGDYTPGGDETGDF